MDTLRINVDMTEKRKASLGSIFIEKRDQVRNFIKKRIRNISVVEDLLQDVFTQMINAYENIDSMDAWLYTVARNRIYDYYRKKKPESLEEIIIPDETNESLSSFLPDLVEGPEQAYLKEAIWEEVMEVLDGLPAEQREAFAMHELENYSIKEIADHQGVSVNTVLSRKRYAVTALKRELEQFYQELIN